MGFTWIHVDISSNVERGEFKRDNRRDLGRIQCWILLNPSFLSRTESLYPGKFSYHLSLTIYIGWPLRGSSYRHHYALYNLPLRILYPCCKFRIADFVGIQLYSQDGIELPCWIGCRSCGVISQERQRERVSEVPLAGCVLRPGYDQRRGLWVVPPPYCYAACIFNTTLPIPIYCPSIPTFQS